MCFIDSQLPEEFPVISLHHDNVSSTGSTATTSTTNATLYLCICPDPDFTDVRMTRSYCPLGFGCGIPHNPNATVQCIDSGPIMNHVAQTAWPVFLSSMLFLVVLLVATPYGVALYKFLNKALWRLQLKLRRTEDENENNPSPLDVRERWEVQHLMELEEASATSSSTFNNWYARLNQPYFPPPPPRWRIIQYQEYCYTATILERARTLWRREWIHYQNESSRPPPSLLLPVKKYHTDKDYTTTSMQQQQQHEVQDEEDASPTCSICIVAFTSGDRIGDLMCGHEFHADCLKAWLGTGRRNTCPLCQAPHIAKPQFDVCNGGTTTTTTTTNRPVHDETTTSSGHDETTRIPHMEVP